MSTTTLRPTASPAYVPRSFRPTSPFPNAGGSGSASNSPSLGGSGSSHHHHPSALPSRNGPSARLEHPLPSRPASPMPPSLTPRLSADRIGGPAAGNATASSGSGAGSVPPPAASHAAHAHERDHHASGLGHGHASANGHSHAHAHAHAHGGTDRKGSSLRNEINMGSSAGSSPAGGSVRRLPSIKKKDRGKQGDGELDKEIRGNGDVGEVEDGEVREVSEATKKNAREVLRLLANLPAPLPEILPPTFLPTPQATPAQSPDSFASYARSTDSGSSASPGTVPHPLGTSIGKRRRSSSPLSGSVSGGGPAVGLGLGLMEGPAKRARPSSMISASLTPSQSYSGFGGKQLSPEMKRVSSLSGSTSALGRSVTPASARRDSRGPAGEDRASQSPTEGKDTWSRAKWAEAATIYKSRAILLKRHGDAHLRLAGAKPQFLHLPADALLGLVSLTDAVLLWIYAYWCDEQAEGRVKTSPYRDSQALRDFVRGEWEKWVRKGWAEYEASGVVDKEALREMGDGMIGLMYLIEAVIQYHLSAEQLTHLNRRSTQMNALATSTSSSHGGGSSSGQAGAALNNPSPHSTSGASPSGNSIGPSPHSASSGNSTNGANGVSGGPGGSGSGTSPPNDAQATPIPGEIFGLISASTAQSARAAQNLLAARHHLPLSLLRTRFPATYEHAIHSELSDESLPAPNDTLGAARKVDIDVPERFVWPIEFGMCAPVAHLAVFGRGLVREVVSSVGGEWDVRLGA